MLEGVVWNLDLCRYRVAASNRSIARVDWCIVNTSASLAVIITFERLASKPIVAMTGLIIGAVRTVVASLAINVGARQDSLLEAILGGLLLSLGGNIVGVEKLVDNVLVLANAVGVHATMVTVVVDAPLDVNNLARFISSYRLFAPVCTRLVVVNTDSSVIAAWATSSDFGLVEIGPGGDWLQDGAFRASIGTSLGVETSSAHRLTEISVSVDNSTHGGE